MKKSINYYFLGLSLLLITLGLLFLSTLSAISSLQTFGNTNHYLFRQLTAVIIGLVIGLVAFKTPLQVIKKIAPILLVINLVGLVVVFLPLFGTELFGASRWISIGNRTFQPSEFFKIIAIIYLASWLSSRVSDPIKKGRLMVAKKGFGQVIKVYLPFLCFLGIIVSLFIMQRDVTTMGIICFALIAIYFCAGTPLWHTLATIILGASSAAFLIIKEPYRFERLLVFLHPETDPLGMGLQLKQSMIALGSGGWFGKGLGMSTQKFGFLPSAMADSIFAILGEETGIVGCAAIIILFLLFLYFGFKITNSATDKFSKLTAIGITVWIVFQALVNIASTMGLFPISGVPLPFFSHGGSHVIAEIIGIGILLNISKNG